jgi:pimeloyl-ACP methyl ester carboxylesterase
MNDLPYRSPPQHFIVLVPGYMGSRLKDRNSGEIVWLDIPRLLSDPFHIQEALTHMFEQMRYPNDNLEPAGIMDQVVFVPPLFKQEHYGRLLKKLESIGYDAPGGSVYPDRTPVYTFAYDWRQDNRISARQLGEAIRGWRSVHPDSQVWIIGHSNGGIVARWYIEKEGGLEYVSRLFLMGSPWDGAPKAMKVLIDGLDIFLLRLFNRYDIPRLTRDLILSFPSYYQLIPYYYPFLYDQDGEVVDPFKDMGWLDNERQRQMLLDGKRFNEEMGTKLSVETLCFFGVKKATTVGGVVRTGPDGRWDDVLWDLSQEGDGTVPMRSAVHPNAREKLPFTVGHGDIYVNPDVLDKLEWELHEKYRAGVLAVAETERYRIQFEPEGDVFDPGASIFIWATVSEKENGSPVYDVKINARLEWAQGLPGIDQSPPDEFPQIELSENRQIAGRYEGTLTAPDALGYYRLVTQVEIANDQPIHLEELVLVEGQIEPESFIRPSDLEETASEWAPQSPSSDTLRTWSDDEESEPIRGNEDSGYSPPGPSQLTRETSAYASDDELTPQVHQRYLQAEICEHDPGQALPLDQESTLAFFVDMEADALAIPLEEERLYSSGEVMIQLSVQISSQDFTVHTDRPQVLRLPRHGKSRNKARFDIEPKHSGIGELTALFYKDNNFIQGLNLKLNVANSGPAIAEIKSLGRPLEGMPAVQHRDLLLFIKNLGDRFDLTLVGATAAHASLPITPQELNYKILEARRALLDVVYLAHGPSGIFVHPRNKRPAADISLPFQTGIQIPEMIANEALKRLAAAGYLLYQDLFYSPNAPLEANLLGDRLRELAEQNTLKLQIVSQEFFLPWGLLYLVEFFDPDDIQAERFLGLKHIIEHIPLQERMPVFESDIHSLPHLAVSLNVDAQIDQQMGLTVIQDQLQYWQDLNQRGKAALEIRQTDQDFLAALKDPQTPDQILYFYGHARSYDLADSPGPDESALALTGGKTVTLRDLRLNAPARKVLPGYPLVFINACESAELSPLFYGGFMPYFTAKGARGMIGTECEVPARFAAEWARRFFDKFLYEGKPIGEIFLSLRQEFYHQHNNLLGLLYALYCDGDTRVTPRLS